MEKRQKIIVILGPTSSGKSDIAIKLARKFKGEIISADSRQVYRGLDIGTGKITKAEQKLAKHHLIDNVSPRSNYNAARFKKDAEKIIKDIIKHGKLPIICGGTGFWIKSIVDNVNYPEVKPDWKLRSKLEKYPVEKLLMMLKKMDPGRAKNIDAKNKVRLIRAIEICKSLGRVPKLDKTSDVQQVYEERHRMSNQLGYDFLQIGISLPKEKLHQNIKKRLEKRFRQGMIKEVENLHKKEKLSWKKIESFGLGYFWIPKYLHPVEYFSKRKNNFAKQNLLNGVKSKQDLFDKIFQAEKDYAKRQMTWWKIDQRIKWLDNYKNIEKETINFLKN